jgi:hypothetical protein
VADGWQRKVIGDGDDVVITRVGPADIAALPKVFWSNARAGRGHRTPGDRP